MKTQLNQQPPTSQTTGSQPQAGEPELTLHQKFEEALDPHKGSSKHFSKKELGKIIQDLFPEVPNGSVLPTDHAEPSIRHVNQCPVCREEAYQLLTTAVDGEGKPQTAEYKVRNFQQSPREIR